MVQERENLPDAADGDEPGLLDTPPAAAYRVLARKYRPQSFAELIGQEAMVRTLTNAFASGRIAHAFILTGVRGVGKTTTARIIAKALNCVAADGAGGPTIEPCGVCDNCRAIAEDRHIDVMEMDAASRTGVDDIREILDGVRYLPVSARTKVYIIDEVHMLSKHAFNALLKTLEEPPEHVKFVFATTEIRKVPVTVLSRCQRFDLRRVPAQTLIECLSRIAAAEDARVEPDALALIVRAADGSVRDGLSLLDQAIAHGAGAVDAVQVREMLGLADAARTFDLMDTLMRGDAKAALELLVELYNAGAEPLVVMQDLLDITHRLTRLIVAPDAAPGPASSEAEHARSSDMARRLDLPVLARAWQMLMKGLGEVQASLAPLQAAEMALVRLCFAADLPPPGELVQQLQASAATPPAGAHPAPGKDGGPVAPPAASQAVPTGAAPGVTAPAPGPAAALAQPRPAAEPTGFRDLVELFGARGELTLQGHLIHNVHLVRFEAGRLTIRPASAAPRDLTGAVLQCLRGWLGSHWQVLVADDEGAPTLAAQDEAAQDQRLSGALQNPVVRAVMEAFPGAQVTRITPRDGAGAAGGEAAGPDSAEEGSAP